MDSLIKFFAGRHKAYLHNAPAFERLAPCTLQFRNGLAREQTYLDSANQLLLIRWSNFCGSLKIEPL